MSDIRRGLPLTRSRIEKIFPKLTPAQISRIEARGHIRTVQLGEILVEQGGYFRTIFCRCLRRARGYTSLRCS